MDTIPFYTYIELENHRTDLMNFVLFYASYFLKILQFGLTCLSDRSSSERHGYSIIGGNQCPEVRASYPAQLVYSWVTSLVVLGYRKGLEESDVWDLNPRDTSERLEPQFEKYWKRECLKAQRKSTRSEILVAFANGQSKTELSEKSPMLMSGQLKSYTKSTSADESNSNPTQTSKKKEKKPSLLKVLTAIHIKGLTISFVSKFFADIFQFISPLILGEMISFMSNRNSMHAWRGYILAIGLLVFGTLRAVLFQISLHRASVIGMQMKSALITAIYKKALTMNNEAKKFKTAGEVVNLMSVDCQRLQELLNYLALLWSTPFQIILALVLLYTTIGPAVFAGVVVLILMIPFNAYYVGKERKLQEENLKIKDTRIKWMTEILNGMKVLKLYGWEMSFKEKVEKIRASEIKVLMKIAYVYIMVGMGWAVAPFIVTLATFATYILIDSKNVLDAQKAFVTLSLFNLLRVPLNLLGVIINFSIQSFVSVKRLNEFLLQPDLDPDSSIKDTRSEYALSINDGQFKWDKDMPPVLNDININIPEGKLITVVGQVGCGKSSLISALLGEMEKERGSVTVKGSIAYVSQQAWMKYDTLRDNILFGKPFNHTKYKATIEACALSADLEILPGGDMTEIGEKGINLSGGQKQRVSLARALYSDADIYLFDDPLSAVDSHVGKHIFKKAIGPFGCLKNKTRVLVTHGVHWLPMVDNILVMTDGRITERGTYTELLKVNGEFAQFLKIYLTQGIGLESDEELPDEEIEDMRERMWDKIEALTSDAMTSGDENPITERKRRRSSFSGVSGRHSFSRMSLSVSIKQLPRRETVTEIIEKGKLTELEVTGQGKIPLSVVKDYVNSAGPFGLLLGVFFYILFQAASVGSTFWLTYWTGDSQINDPNFQQNQTSAFVNKNHLFLGIYGLFGVVQVVMIIVHSLFYWTRLVRAAKTIHANLLQKLFRAPMSFMDTTPIGRIVNRISRDIETIDSTLPQVLKMWLSTFMIVLSTLLVISITTPIFIAVLVPIAIFYYLIQCFYIPTSRQLKRIESVTRSPIYTHFSETINGASTIRAYGASNRFIEDIKNKVDKNQIFYFAGLVSNRWLGLNLDVVSSVVVFAASILAVQSTDTGAGDIGLSVSYALQIAAAISWMVRQMSDLETNIVSVERVLEYSKIDSEAELTIPENQPRPDWPDQGCVSWFDYETRYRPGLDLVLKGINCDINGGEKIGIIGRTGAGKSSMFLTLFRLIEPSNGDIVIDGVHISKIGLHDLRSKLTILPQDPVLFSGSLRMNLDPFDEYSDYQIWTALAQSHLKPFVEGLPETIMYECGEGGCNLSVGQRQLVCLARTLLRRTKILVLDEATAAVDYETDSLIQQTIRTAFKDCTIITIAHRINTIMDYDRVAVMDEGKIIEFDSPTRLLDNNKSQFYSMAKEAGIVT
ncbi:multidrug resistance-associated protein 1 [Patella vulgata]|uniref:multidrug resistance-associated protein 1 n=1 Tax=Patella vulgata TaxID=6465 RepID=UPI0024A8AED4|nr:multidrug resistance-associated protein 1 [Patella vulgata]